MRGRAHFDLFVDTSCEWMKLRAELLTELLTESCSRRLKLTACFAWRAASTQLNLVDLKKNYIFLSGTCSFEHLKGVLHCRLTGPEIACAKDLKQHLEQL